MKKRDEKGIDKDDDSYHDEYSQWTFQNQGSLSQQYIKPRRMNLVELYQNYQSVLNEEYILKLFYFTTMVQQYCLCEYIDA